MGTLSGQRMASAWARGDLASLVWGGMALLWEGTGERPQGRVDSEDSWAWVLPPPHRLEGKILPSLAPPACWRCAHPASPAPAGLPNCFPLSERAGCERLIRRDKRPIGKQALPLPGHRSPRLFWVLCPWPCLSLKRQWAACGRSWEHVGVLLRRGGQHPAGKDQEPSLTSELLGSYYVLDLASCFWTLAP